MKSPRLPLLTLGVALAALGGCNHASSPVPGSGPAATGSSRPVTYALAVSVAGGLQPTPAQWASIQATFSRILAAEGLVLVTDLSLADRILRIDFLPDLADPENRGQAVIVSVRPNTQRGSLTTLSPTLASYSPYPSPFGWNGNSWGSYYGFGYDPYYGYGNSYYDGYSYGSPTLNPRRPVPPPPVNPPGFVHHHHSYPGKPDPKDPDGLRHHPHPPLPPGKCPPLLAATTPATTTPDPVVYPGSAPGRNTVFQDDIRLTRPERTLAWTTPDSRYDGSRGGRADAYRARQDANSGPTSAPAEHRSWLSRLVNPGDSNSSTASNTSQRGDRTYTRSDSGGSDRTWSRGDSNYSRNDSGGSRSDSSSSRADSYHARSDSSYSRSDSSSRSDYSSRSSSGSSGGSSYSHSSSSYSPPASSSSSSSSGSSSSSYSAGSSSYSSSGSSSSSSGGSSGSSSSGSSSSGTTQSRTAER